MHMNIDIMDSNETKTEITTTLDKIEKYAMGQIEILYKRGFHTGSSIMEEHEKMGAFTKFDNAELGPYRHFFMSCARKVCIENEIKSIDDQIKSQSDKLKSLEREEKFIQDEIEQEGNSGWCIIS